MSNRTTASIYHMITGKKSVQTMQDIHIYELQDYYGIYPTLSMNSFQTLIWQLKQQKLLDVDQQNYFQLTEQGKAWLLNQKRRFSPGKFSGLKYNKLASTFSDRLLLIVQTIANNMMGNYRFIPVVDKHSIQSWVKTRYKSIKSQANDYRKKLYQELDRVLHTLTEQEANIFVDRLTGYKIYGKSSQQLAEIYHLPLIDIPLVWTRMIHQVLEIIQSDKENYPVLCAMIADESEQTFITTTAKKTYELLLQGYTLENIAAIRRLKMNTIYDHVVETALVQPSFSITPFVSSKTYEKIAQAIEQTNNYSLKQLKEKAGPDISYFQLRLVLATIKQKQGGKHGQPGHVN